MGPPGSQLPTTPTTPARPGGGHLAATGLGAGVPIAGLLVLAVVSVVLTALDDAGSVPLALGGAALLAIFGVALVLLARGLRALKPPSTSKRQ